MFQSSRSWLTSRMTRKQEKRCKTMNKMSDKQKVKAEGEQKTRNRQRENTKRIKGEPGYEKQKRTEGWQ